MSGVVIVRTISVNVLGCAFGSLAG